MVGDDSNHPDSRGSGREAWIADLELNCNSDLPPDYEVLRKLPDPFC